MNTYLLRRLSAAVAFTLTLGTGTAMAADYVTIVQDVTVDRAADVVWKKVGGYCDIAAWLNVTCVLTAGSGEVGSMRHLNDRIDEVMVAKTDHSYTYTQPTTTILYHGTLAVEALGAKRSKLVYTLFYDQEPLATPEAKAADHDQRAKRFAAALQTMKGLAEAK